MKRLCFVVPASRVFESFVRCAIFDGVTLETEVIRNVWTLDQPLGERIGLLWLFLEYPLAPPAVPISFAMGETAVEPTLALTDGNGSISTTYQYDPYGNTTNAGAVSAYSSQYAGRENDFTGLYYNRARYYSPALGRFISQDPLGMAAGLNEYEYASGNPISFIDPMGMDKSAGGPGHGPGGKGWIFGPDSPAGLPPGHDPKAPNNNPFLNPAPPPCSVGGTPTQQGLFGISPFLSSMMTLSGVPASSLLGIDTPGKIPVTLGGLPITPPDPWEEWTGKIGYVGLAGTVYGAADSSLKYGAISGGVGAGLDQATGACSYTPLVGTLINVPPEWIDRVNIVERVQLPPFMDLRAKISSVARCLWPPHVAATVTAVAVICYAYVCVTSPHLAFKRFRLFLLALIVCVVLDQLEKGR